MEGNDGKDFKVCKNKAITQTATDNARQQAHTGAGNVSMFDRDGIALTGYDNRNPPPAVDPDSWAGAASPCESWPSRHAFWRCCNGGGMKIVKRRSARAGGPDGSSTTTAARCNQSGRGGKQR